MKILYSTLVPDSGSLILQYFILVILFTYLYYKQKGAQYLSLSNSRMIQYDTENLKKGDY